MAEEPDAAAPVSANALSNADIARRLLSLARLLSAQKENPFKVKAYRRAAQAISNLPESLEDLVRAKADLTKYPGIGKAISSAIREIVESGGALQKLEKHREAVGPELAAMSEYPRLDPRRVARIYKKLRIGSLPELRERLERGDVREQFGERMDQHVRQALTDSRETLLYHAHPLVSAVRAFLVEKCGVKRADVAGDYRRLVEVIGELTFVISMSLRQLAG